MAIVVNTNYIDSLPIVSYQELRSKLQSGDLFFTSGNYLLSKAIQKVTNSPWSHVGIVCRIDKIERVLLLESVEDMGVRFTPLSKYLEAYENGTPYQGRIVIARCNDLNPKAAESILRFGIDELTQPYDKDEIAKILARITLGIGKAEIDREYICSELVHACFSKAGKDFHYNPKGFISPNDIWIDKSISLLGRIL